MAARHFGMFNAMYAALSSFMTDIALSVWSPSKIWSFDMLQVRSIVLRGKGVKDAVVSFGDRANILAGASDTGKSYLVHCLDYIFGANSLNKRIDEAEPYSSLLVEFENSKGAFLTLERSLSGGNITAHRGKIDRGKGDGEVVVPRRRGKSHAQDVTAVLFAFADIAEAELRSNSRGNTHQLTIRTILPLFLVDEVSVIDERSPVLGRVGFDDTARKRAFAYMLTGKDDTGIVASEKKEIVGARWSSSFFQQADPVVMGPGSALAGRSLVRDDSVSGGRASRRTAQHRHPLRRHRQRDQREHLQCAEALSLPAQDAEDVPAPARVLRSRRRHAVATRHLEQAAAGFHRHPWARHRLRARRQCAVGLRLPRQQLARGRPRLSVRLLARRLHGARAGGADPQGRA